MIAGEIVITQTRVDIDNVVRCTFCQNGMTSGFGVLDKLFDESDTEHLATLVGASSDNSRDTAVKKWIELFEYRCFSDSRFGFVTSDIQVLF